MLPAISACIIEAAEMSLVGLDFGGSVKW